MKFHTIAFVILFALSAPATFATAQFPDYVSIDGKSAAMHSNPLEPYFARHPEKRPKTSVTSSALWRGYIAYFAITDGKLQVADIQVYDKIESTSGEPKMRSVMDEVFPVSADRTVSWLTGFLILPQGEVVSYVHMGYASTFERYRLILVKEGRVLAERVFSHEEYVEYRQRQFAAFTGSAAYRKIKQDLEGRSNSITAENFLYVFDVNFPMETLIDYKDFRPTSALKADSSSRPK